jgi:hypothetical protein
MDSALPTTAFFSEGFPAALNDLKALPEPIESDLILGLYALLRASGMAITYPEADVISGHAPQFIYSLEHPECVNIAFVPPVETLFRALDVTWKEVTPSGSAAAYAVLQDWISAGKVSLARLKEPLLVYGYRHSGPNHSIVAARLSARLEQQTISLLECDAKYWRYPLDDGNVLIAVDSAPRHAGTPMELIRTAARRALRIWHTPQLAGCACGDQAYRHFIADLSDNDVDFCDEKHSPWMGAALWRQWTARASSNLFFDRAAPRFGSHERAAVTKAAFCYGQCTDAWMHWAEHLGPTWHRGRHGFVDPLPPDFIARWRNREARMKAAHWLEEARGWEEKAVAELTRIVH